MATSTEPPQPHASLVSMVPGTEPIKSCPTVDYVLRSLVPLLTGLVNEARATTTSNAFVSDSDPLIFLGLWVLRHRGCPLEALAGVLGWLGLPHGANASTPHIASPRDKTFERQTSQRSSRSSVTSPKGEEATASSAGVKFCDSPLNSDSDNDGLTSKKENGEEPQNPRMTSRRSSGTAPAMATGPRPQSGQKRRFTVNISSEKIRGPPVEEKLSIIRNLKYFAGYTEPDLKSIAEITTCVRYHPDEVVRTFGSPCDDLHIILEGEGMEWIPQASKKVTRGAVLGEEALLAASSLNPTHVTSSTGQQMICLQINKRAFQGLRLDSAGGFTAKKGRIGQQGGRRASCDALPGGRAGSKLPSVAALAGNVPEELQCPCTGREMVREYVPTQADKAMIINSLTNNKVLSEVLQLSEGLMEQISTSVYLVKVPPDQMFITKGEFGNALFVIQDGILDVHLTTEMKAEFRCRTGDSFGELALLYDTPRQASLTTVRECLIWVLPRTDFQGIVRMGQTDKFAKHAEMLSKIEGLRELLGTEHYDKYAAVLEEISFVQDEEVCIKGQDEDVLFIIEEGICEQVDDGFESDGLQTPLYGKESPALYQAGDWLGVDQLLKSIPAEHTVRVTSENATILALDMAAIQAVKKSLDPDSDGAESPTRQGTLKDKYNKRKSRGALFGADTLKIQSLERIGWLGEGTFGSVLLMQDNELKRSLAGETKFYAVKIMFKEHIFAEDLQDSVVAERTIMSQLDSKFIVKFFKAYEDDNLVFLVLEACTGGELFDVYADEKLFGKLKHAKFYVGCITLALEHMHKKRIIYRDLKLENCLLDHNGYCKLTDMGIAKVVVGKTYTICGTADFLAPETLRQTGHNRAVDWWACGVVLFIMASGISPFDAPNVTQIYKNIVKGFSKVSFPSTMPSDCTDVIKSLCRKKPEERITMQKGGVENLKSMPFFTRLDWEALEEQKLPPPFQPSGPNFEAIKAKQLSTSDRIKFDIDDIWDWDGVEPLRR
eukprot:TRINITY_DN42517_c0_g1_i1.p1 TRINITY_DN42517_c0_g1~~TRINITY_DN42517_c0_g1_i1.p1  ORF type:complete len:1003 (+),score=175.34 TRINITY_DN42517_c0_g1_i1:141-3149(+)